MTPRILLFDIEATSLEASFGYVLAFGFKYLGGETTVLTLKDFATPRKHREPDANLLTAVHRRLTDESDIIVTYYGKEYDRKFLNTRLLMSSFAPLPPLNAEHVDLYYTVRGNFKLHSGRLQGVSEALGCPMSKTPVRADTWRKAQRGDLDAMAYVSDHCRLDVDILEWCYLKLRPFVRQHPPVSTVKEACRVCGGVRWESRGYRFRLGGPQQRLRCQGCGAWDYKLHKK